MHSYSQHPHDDINEDVFDDDDTNHQFKNSSSDIKLRRTNADTGNFPILYRALSTVSANQTLVHNQRNLLAKNFRRISVNDEIVTIDHNDADASFLLPNLFELPDEIRTRVMDSLVDTPTMTSLEETKRLNWWTNKKLPCPRLYPLLTSGDGNCLLHATSLAMWGFHDHSLSMRKALNETMITSKPNNSLYRRWRWAQSVQNKKYGLVFSEQEWNEEWKGLLRLSSAEPRVSQTSSSNSNVSSSEPNPPSTDENNRLKLSQTVPSTNTGGSTKSSSQSTRQYYESLEEFHVYVLANNIRRPIIVYSDTVLRTNDGEAISPIEFGGIYLPLEIPPEKCHKQPVFLAFDAAHFSALVPMEQNNSKPASRVTYRIPLIDIDAVDLLPIHYFIDPGPDFAWPIDEELSDEKIHLYTHYGESRMEILENYLNLSKEICPLSTLTTASTPTNATPDEINSSIENPSPSSNTDGSISTNETPSTVTPVINKKGSRPSLNSFSKIIRRTFIEPFSSAKRASLKHQRQQGQLDVSNTLIRNENEPVRRASSPLLNRRTNILTIIVTNFQPKRPKTSDNMIKNYIDACMNEYQLEKNHQQITEPSIHENEKSIQYSDWNQNLPAQTSTSYNRNTSSVNNNNNNNHHHHHRHPTNEKFIEPITRKLPALPNNRMISPTKRLDIDDNDDLLPTENGPFSSNINYVQPTTTQRKHPHITQSNSQDMSYARHPYPESYINGLSSNRTSKTDSTIHRPTMNVMPSTFQPSVQRQQSLGYEKNLPIQRIPPESNSSSSSSSSHRGPYKPTNLNHHHHHNYQQPVKRSINENTRQLNHFEQQQHKRL